MGFIEWIKELMSGGILPTVGTMIVGALTIGLEVAKNKLVKKLSKSEADNTALAEKIAQLEEDNKKQGETTDNTNAIVSTILDMLHVAYSSSKLSLEAKLQLQKIYDNCPDALTDKLSLVELIGQEPTIEQEEAVSAVKDKSYAEVIAEKYKE